MRARFFWIIFSVLFVVACGAGYFHKFFLFHERLSRFDVQVREIAAIIIDAENSKLRRVNLAIVDDILQEELGDNRVKKFFLIRDNDGNLLYESAMAKELSLRDTPLDQQWTTISRGRLYVRILNLKLPRIPNRTLQVGIATDSEQISIHLFNTNTFGFFGVVFALGLLSAWLLTSTLLRPIAKLVDFLTKLEPGVRLENVELPKGLTLSKYKNDELNKLIESFRNLFSKVARSHRLSRAWSYQMAHELKTPLAVMEGVIARAKKTGEMQEEPADSLRRELIAASDTVTAFLTWAELEGASKQKDLYASSARQVAQDIARRLELRFPGRLKIEISADFYVMANRQHFEHLLLNLLQNSLLYSGTQPVRLSSPAPHTLLIEDQGPGIPAKVLERFGEPFNRGDRRDHGHGLGLAFVHSVCRLYGWKEEVHSTAKGTEVRVFFPNDLESDLLPSSSPNRGLEA